jgi:sugar/nucleoside kinase (ribokinase family)
MYCKKSIAGTLSGSFSIRLLEENASMTAGAPQKDFDLLVVGEINPDLILSGNAVPAFGQVEKLVDGMALSVGSSAVIFACGAARLGLRVAFSGKVGQDFFGEYMLKEMARRGIDTQGVIRDPVLRTGLSVILSNDNDRAILTYPGTIPELRFDEIDPALLARARHLHLASYFIQTRLRPDVSQLFALAHASGLTTSLDTNYDPSEGWDGGLRDVLAQTDVFLPNETELRKISGLPALESALAWAGARVPLTAVKLGKLGAAACRDGVEVHAASIPVEKIVDTVGAGDSFDAGLIYGYLQGWELEACLQLGVTCGSLSTQQAGGVDGQPSLEEARRCMRHYGLLSLDDLNPTGL